jgi:branched-chain amino acid transport system ATP-binding protein
MEAISNLVAATGIRCVIVEQYIDVVLEFSAKVLALERGRYVFLGPVEAFARNPQAGNWPR